ncbi:cadherin-1 [Synchiropus splendidus]|uniref:cadherin-1 n=1 Tax=Synchiropus splendidus TaxID=270530 RepID=UPI00237ECBEA|nr:cadherin-1 [Synchiropus splendidus]
MGAARVAVWGALIVLFQVSVSAEEPQCQPGFHSDVLTFKVTRRHLMPRTPLGKVNLTTCSDRLPLYFSDNSRFTVRNGVLEVKRPVTLHGGHFKFYIHTWVKNGHKVTALVNITLQGHHHHHQQQSDDQPSGLQGNGDYGYGGRHRRYHGDSQLDREHHHGGHHRRHRGDGQWNGHHHDGGRHGGHHRSYHDDDQLNGEHHRGHRHGGHHRHHHDDDQLNGEHRHGRRHRGHHRRHHGDGQWNGGHHHGVHHRRNQSDEQQNVQHHRRDDEKHRLQTDVDHSNETQSSGAPDVPVLYFPKSTRGLSRRKRDWVIPDLSVVENDRGPYPLKVSQIRSNADLVKKIFYSITGPGADQDPVGLFTIDRNSGTLYLTQPLDREKCPRYTFQAHAVAEGSGTAEEPMDIIVNVIDQNDNKPVFSQDTYLGEVAEASPKEFEVIKVVATDLDQENTDNSDIRYSIISQEPQMPSASMFVINPVNGAIRVNAGGLDREKYPKYTLEVLAADMVGEGLSGKTKVILTVTDSNDNAPEFTESLYKASVPENKVDAILVTMAVTDGDEPHSAAWNAKFKIVAGDPDQLFSVRTGINKHEGILSTAKSLDFEKQGKHTLLVAVENEVPFAVPLKTATATVEVTVMDVNEAPIFDPAQKLVSKREDLAVDSDVVQYLASDPDRERKQTVMYKILSDPAGWLNVGKDTGLITVKSKMDRESHFVKDNKYTALIGAYDNDEVPATGTGTLMIQLEDVNDNAPTIVERTFRVCNKKTVPQLLSVTDKDGPGFAAPYSVSLQGASRSNWTARMNDSKTGIIVNLATELPQDFYTLVLRVADNQGLEQDSTVQAEVCDCSGDEVQCKDPRVAAAGLPMILGILGGILLLLMLLLLLLLFARRGRREKKEPLLQDDDVRDNIYYYDEEGGGEDDQDYDLGVLHQGLDNRPGVFRDDVVPNFMPAPKYRQRPANPDEIGNFIDDNLKAADNDPTAPPYDSLLVFDYEGGGSDAGSLSSLNSDSSGDQDYDCLNDWGPRFKKLADMYGGEDDDML